MSTINIGTSSNTAFKVESDTTGALTIKTGAGLTTAVTVDAAGCLLIGGASTLGAQYLGQVVSSQSNTAIAAIKNTAAAGYSGIDHFNSSGTNIGFIGSGNASAGITALQNALAVMTNGAYPVVLATDQTARLTVGSTGNVGIGISPSYRLHVSGGKAVVQATASDASYGIFQIGNTTGAGEASMAFVSGATALGGTPTSADGDNYVWAMGAGVYGIGGNNFGIGNKGAGSYVCKIAYNSGSWTFSSDERLKNIVEEIDPVFALGCLDSIRSVIYTKKSDEAKARRVGFIAQDWLPHLPEVVDVPPNDGYLGLAYSDTSPFLLAAIKGLKQQVIELAAEVALLKGNQ